MQSSFILEGTIDKYLNSYTKKYAKKYATEIAEIRVQLYIDYLITRGEVASLKDIAIEILNEAGFKLHE